MSTNYLSIQVAGTDVSNRAMKIVTSRKATEGVGTFQLTLYNGDGALTSSSFPVDSVFNFALGTQLNSAATYPFFNGYVDSVDLVQSQDQNNKNFQSCIVTGRDYGQDLQNKTVWGSDSNAIEQIVYNLLVYGGSPPTPAMIAAHTGPGIAGYTEITYTLPGAFSGVQCLFNSEGRTFIQSNLKKIMGNVNWDCYVDNNKNFQMFPVGTVSSGVVLSVLTNQNIMGDIHYIPVDGAEIRNVIVGYGGSVNDSWTDVNMAQYWECTNNCVIADYLSGASLTFSGSGSNAVLNSTMNSTTVNGGPNIGLSCSGFNEVSGGLTVNINQTPSSPDPFQLVQAGASSLLIINNNANQSNPVTWGLTFPKFFHWWLPFNWISTGTIQWSMFMHSPSSSATPEGQPQPAVWGVGGWISQPCIYMTDTIGNQIVWIFGGKYRFNSWTTFSVPVGYNLYTEAQVYTASIYSMVPVKGKGTHTLNWWFGLPIAADCTDKWVYTAWSNNSQNQGFNWQVTNITFGFYGALNGGGYSGLIRVALRQLAASKHCPSCVGGGSQRLKQLQRHQPRSMPQLRQTIQPHPI